MVKPSRTCEQIEDGLEDGLDETWFAQRAAGMTDPVFGASTAGERSLPPSSTAGNRTLEGNNNTAILHLTQGHDTFFHPEITTDLAVDGLGGNDSITTGSGNDLIYGGAGNDILEGGSGSDTLSGAEGHDSPYGGSGNDVLYGGSGDDALIGGAGDDYLYGGGGLDILFGENGNDSFIGDAGTATYYGGAGFDTVFYNTAGAVTVDLIAPHRSTGDAAGDLYNDIEEFYLSIFNDQFVGGAAAEVVHGLEGRDFLFGGDGDDTLFGDGGDDSLSGGIGDDILDGGGDNDLLFGGAGNDRLLGRGGADFINGGDGFDIVDYTTANGRVSIDLGAPSSTWIGIAQGDTLINVEEFHLTSFGDNFAGDANANVVRGFGGNDTIDGGAGDDQLFGGNGVDQVIGGSGADTLEGNAGDDAIYGGEGDDILIGGAGNDTLFGDSGDDVLFGNAGADSLNGGEGNDLVSYLSATAEGVNIDLNTASSTWTGIAFGDTLTGIEEFQLTNFADSFTGDANANTVYGEAGDDTIIGGGGNDILVGGDGKDTIQGGDGNDEIIGDQISNPGGAGDLLYGGTGNDIVSGGGDGDFLYGGAGADIFRYRAVEESQNVRINGVSQLDSIFDFSHDQDLIDLSAIDANGALSDDQAFTFLADPTHHTGDWTGLVWSVTDNRGVTTVYASTDADADSDMAIYTQFASPFSADDFIL